MMWFLQEALTTIVTNNILCSFINSAFYTKIILLKGVYTDRVQRQSASMIWDRPKGEPTMGLYQNELCGVVCQSAELISDIMDNALYAFNQFVYCIGFAA